MPRPPHSLLFSALAAAALLSPAVSQSPDPGILQVLYSEHDGIAQNQVPGMPGATLDDISMLRVSPAGVVAVQVRINNGGQYLDALMVGDRVVLKDGDPLPWATSEMLHLIRDFAVNDAGKILVSLESTGPAATSSYLVREDAPGAWTVLALEGDPLPGLPGKVFGTQYGAAIDSLDRAGLMSDGISGGVSSDEAITFNNTILGQTGVDAPNGQLSGGNEVYAYFDSYFPLFVNADGSQWMSQAYLQGSGNEVLVVNDTVEIQAGYAIPGASTSLPVSVNGIRFSTFDRAGNWYAHGFFNPSSHYWAVQNGVDIARTGLAIHSGSTETWRSNTQFDLVAGNGTDYVVAGSATDFLSHLVRNNSEILCSQLDDIDVDGNGAFDDSHVLQGFGSGYMTDDGSVIILARTRSLVTGRTYPSVVKYDNNPAPKLNVTNLVAGSAATIEVAPVAEGNIVFSGYSLTGGGPTTLNFTPWGPLTLALTEPFELLPNMTADATGSASMQVNVPVIAIGLTVWMQALEDEGNGAYQLTNGFAGVVQ